MTPRIPRLALLLLASFSIHAVAAPVYEQAPVAGPNVGAVWTSHFNSSNSGWQAQDDFSLGANAAISRVTWRGIYLTNQAPCCGNGAPNTNSWTVEFRQDDGGTPGALAFSKTFADSAVHRSNATDGVFAGNSVDVYDFDLALGSAFAAEAGTNYWFSVRSNADGFSPFFGWTMAGPYEAGDVTFQNSYANGVVTGTFAERGGDRAFALYDVPEPTALALAGVGLLAAGSRRKRSAS